MATKISTSRGVYSISVAAPVEHTSDKTIVTVAAERADGVERVAFRCAIADALANSMTDDQILATISGWLARDFEMRRETALKTTRTERRIHEFSFDAGNRGPFV